MWCELFDDDCELQNVLSKNYLRLQAGLKWCRTRSQKLQNYKWKLSNVSSCKLFQLYLLHYNMACTYWMYWVTGVLIGVVCMIVNMPWVLTGMVCVCESLNMPWVQLHLHCQWGQWEWEGKLSANSTQCQFTWQIRQNVLVNNFVLHLHGVLWK